MNKKQLIVGIIFCILVIGMITTLYLLQKPTNSRSHAAASTNINLLPGTGDPTSGTQTNPFQTTVGQTIPVNVQIQPGTNEVSYVQVEIDYDPSVLQVDQSTGFTLTNASKMFFLEGPVYESGKILATFTIGNTFVNAITQPTIVGSIPFQVIGSTDNSNGISSVTISSNSVVYSIDPTNAADTNVLSSTQPFYLTAPANAPTSTPEANTPTPESEPTDTPVPTPTLAPNTVSIVDYEFIPSVITVPVGTTVTWINNSGLNGGVAMAHTTTSDTGLWDSGPIQPGGSFSFTFNSVGTFTYHCSIHPTMQGTVIVTGSTTPTTEPTNTPTPSPTIMPSPTSIPPGSAQLSLSLLLDGLGSAGDNTAPTLNSLSNKNPLTKTRDVSVKIVGDNNTQNTYTGTVQYNASTGTFDTGVNPITILAPYNSGNYAMYITIPFFLTRQVAGIQQFNPYTTLSVTARLVTGDTNNDNQLDILDWNKLLNCQNQAPTGTCLGTDLNDDGIVNQEDTNLFLREYGVEYGDSATSGSN